MNFEAFLEELKKIDIYPHTSRYVRHRVEETEPYLEVSWVTGGVGGGNCWGDVADLPVEPDEEPEFDSLDKIVEALVPNLSFLQYKQLSQTCLERSTDSDGDYYGNVTYRARKTLYLQKLHQKLLDFGLLSNQ